LRWRCRYFSIDFFQDFAATVCQQMAAQFFSELHGIAAGAGFAKYD
jgi:hypothetical protein